MAAAFFGESAGRAEAAPAPPGGFGESLADYGLEPNSDKDQSAAMQKALDELAASGQPAFLPAGRYRISGVRLGSRSALFGVEGFSVIEPAAAAPLFKAEGAEAITLKGLSFGGHALAAHNCRKITISNCEIIASEGDGFFCGGSALFIAGNRVSGCKGCGIRVEGDAMVTQNMIEGAGRFGLRLGAPDRLGNVSAINNMITNAGVGIGVSNADGGYAFISMNMIVGAKGGGIRALHGDAVTGPDLTKSSAESFRNLAIAANVSV
jgi:hypothetical protein